MTSIPIIEAFTSTASASRLLHSAE